MIKRNRFGRAAPAVAAVLMAAALAWLAVPLSRPGAGRSGEVRWEVYPFDEPVLRLHVLAHSDAPADQLIKEQAAVDTRYFLAARLPGAGADDWAMLEALLPELERELAMRLEQAGRPPVVVALLVRESFPLRAYGRHVYPPGEYRSLKIVLGSGEGENWWCLLFPSLCLPVVEARPAGESGKKSPDEPGPMVLSQPPDVPSGRWVLKIREHLEQWASRIAAK